MRRSAENQVRQLQAALASQQQSNASAAKDRRHVTSVQRRLNSTVVVRKYQQTQTLSEPP